MKFSSVVAVLVGLSGRKDEAESLVMTPPAKHQKPSATTRSLVRIESPSQLSWRLETQATEEKVKKLDEFELNKGRCLDVLREDYAAFYDRDLRYDIYMPGLRVIDPSGVEIWGLAAYRQFFAGVRMFRKIACDDVSMMRLNTQYDAARQQVVLQWYSKWTVKGAKEPAYVSAVSTFHLNDKGRVDKHVVDRIMFNGRQMGTPADAFKGLQKRFVPARGPLACPGASRSDFSTKFLALEASTQYLHTMQEATTVKLILQASASSADNKDDNSAPPGTSGGGAVVAGAETSEKKTKRERRSSSASDTKTKKKGGMLARCEFMWDCEAPLNCCDFVAVKVCCGGGQGIPAFLQPPTQPRAIPIPVPVDPYPGQRPPQGPRGPW